MATQLIAGQNGKLSDKKFSFELDVANSGSVNLDASAVLLTENGKVSSDADFIFFNQPEHTSGALAQQSGSVFSVDLDKVPSYVEKIVFVLSIEESLSALGDGYAFRVSGTQDAFEFKAQSQGRPEKSLMIAEIYRRSGAWKVRAVDQGFTGGMGPLAEHFGVDIDYSAEQRSTQSRSSSSDRPADRAVNLDKVTLEKKGDTISLEKESTTFGTIRANLNWNQSGAGQSRGLLGSLVGKKGVDLDLGCMYEFKNGSKGVVQAVGKQFGSFNTPPYISLDGDDRSGGVSDGENLSINGRYWSEIKRVLIFAFIYEGVPNWAQTDGRVIISTPDQPDIEIRIDATGGDQNFCVIALLENRGESLKISKEVSYCRGHRQADEKYGFGFEWKRGRK